MKNKPKPNQTITIKYRKSQISYLMENLIFLFKSLSSLFRNPESLINKSEDAKRKIFPVVPTLRGDVFRALRLLQLKYKNLNIFFDVGCGTGFMLLCSRVLGFSPAGVEFADKDVAIKNGSHIQHFNGTIDMSYLKNSVYSTDFCHKPEKSEWLKRLTFLRGLSSKPTNTVFYMYCPAKIKELNLKLLETAADNSIKGDIVFIEGFFQYSDLYPAVILKLLNSGKQRWKQILFKPAKGEIERITYNSYSPVFIRTK